MQIKSTRGKSGKYISVKFVQYACSSEEFLRKLHRFPAKKFAKQFISYTYLINNQMELLFGTISVVFFFSLYFCVHKLSFWFAYTDNVAISMEE